MFKIKLLAFFLVVLIFSGLNPVKTLAAESFGYYSETPNNSPLATPFPFATPSDIIIRPNNSPLAIKSSVYIDAGNTAANTLSNSSFDSSDKDGDNKWSSKQYPAFNCDLKQDRAAFCYTSAEVPAESPIVHSGSKSAYIAVNGSTKRYHIINQRIPVKTSSSQTFNSEKIVYPERKYTLTGYIYVKSKPFAGSPKARISVHQVSTDQKSCYLTGAESQSITAKDFWQEVSFTFKTPPANIKNCGNGKLGYINVNLTTDSGKDNSTHKIFAFFDDVILIEVPAGIIGTSAAIDVSKSINNRIHNDFYGPVIPIPFPTLTSTPAPLSAPTPTPTPISTPTPTPVAFPNLILSSNRGEWFYFNVNIGSSASINNLIFHNAPVGTGVTFFGGTTTITTDQQSR